MNELHHQQADFIIQDIIFKTFASNKRLWTLLFNVNYRLAELYKQDKENKLVYQAIVFFNFNKLFANKVEFEKNLLDARSFLVSFWDKRALRKSYKKAIATQQWEINKMSDATVSVVEDATWRYLQVFLEMNEYLALSKSQKSPTKMK